MLWLFIFLVLLFFLSLFIIPIRLTLLHPIITVKYAFFDIFDYFRYHKWNICKTGVFDCFDASSGLVFGSGKTLSAVYKVRQIFYKYHNKKIYDIHRKKWVTQKIHILTNLTMKNLPYEKLENLGQILKITESFRQFDIDNDTETCTIVLIDEMQAQLNSRTFRDNISPTLMKALTECRHLNLSIFYDCPRFLMVDKLLRECTSNDIKCRKVWRWQCQSVYDAYDVENCNNIDLIKPLKKTGFFIENDLFDEYDTKEIIDVLIKHQENGEMMTDLEILSLQMNSDFDIDQIRHKSKLAKRRLKSK